eukprot:TRINITY_DN17706_c0_g1_i1.p1 TRINITY_DN17706_c0_g1~~TRINITY_DN17706_c0_g1_i1.p1  ORF type:complete len:388 (+),score=95.98 TRINITY_DN17706_c0_g1_i1:96-1166(+)
MAAAVANWTPVHAAGPAPSPREGHCAFVHGQRMFIFGGSVASALQEEQVTQTNELWCFDFAASSWSRVETDASLVPSPRTCACAAVVGDRAFIFGGLSMADPVCPWSDELFCLDLSTPTPMWVPCAASGHAPSCRDKAACVVLPGTHLVAVFGGFGPVTALPGATEATFEWHDDLHVLDTDAMAWHAVERMTPAAPWPARRCAMAMAPATQTGTALIVGGRTCLGTRANDVWYVVVQQAGASQYTARWVEVVTTGEPPAPRSFHSAVVYGSHLVLFGGLTAANTHTNDVHVLAHSGEHPSWALTPCAPGSAAPEPRGMHTSVVVGNKMAVFGGSCEYSPTINASTKYLGDLILLEL